LAIYKPPASRWRTALAAAAAGLVAGFGAGALLTGGGADPVATLREVRRELSGAASVLEVLVVEYRESVRGGEVRSRTEYQGSIEALERSRERFAGVRAAVRAIDPRAARQADERYAELDRLIARRADPSEVARRAEELAELLAGIVGG
jgi:hypothetical protein